MDTPKDTCRFSFRTLQKDPSPTRTARRTSSLSSLSVRTSDSENTAVRKDVYRLYRSWQLPSIYHNGELEFTGFEKSPSERSTTIDAHLVDWDGKYDPQNPINWPSWKKALNIGCILLMCIISPFTSSVIAPAIPDIMLHFNSNNEYISSFVLSVYVLGYAVGPLLVSPLSELFGRVPLYHFCNTVFTSYTLCCAYSDSLWTLALSRLFAGVGGSVCFALAPSSIADIVPKEKRGAVMALIAIGYNLGPAISPTVGSYLNAAKGWQWVFYLTAILGGSATLLSFACLSESYEPVLLRRVAAQQRRMTGITELRSKLDPEAEKSKLLVLRQAMLMPFRMLFFSPSILVISLMTAIGYGFVYILYTTMPQTFIFGYLWIPKNVGLAYLGTAVGNLLGMVAAGGFSDAFVKRRAAKGDTKPENRLYPMIFFWPLVSIGLFIYAWTTQFTVHYIGALIGSAIFGAGAMSAIFFTGTYVIDAYPTHSASGVAASSVLRSLLGGLAPLFSTRLILSLNQGWGFSLLAFISLAFAPVPWVFYRFGEGWREREKLGAVGEGGKVVGLQETGLNHA